MAVRIRACPAAAGLAAVAVAAALGILFVPPASAHTFLPGVRNILDGVAPSISGVTVSVRTAAADELVLTSTSPATIEVLTDAGEPFLRFTPISVEANTNSVAWYASESLSYNPITSVAGVDPAKGPTWMRVADVGSWAWFDPRLRPDQPADAAATNAPTGKVRLASWMVPIRVTNGGAVSTTKISGHREYRPVEGSYQQHLDAAGPPFPGVTVAVVGGPGSTVPALYVDNETSAVVMVLGAGGEPFLRIGPAETDVNVASPSWLATSASRDEAPDGPVSAAAPPR